MAYPRLQQRLRGGLLLGAITYVFCALAGIGGPNEALLFLAPFGFVVGAIATPGSRAQPGAWRRLTIVAAVWLVLLIAYLVLIIRSSS